MFPGPRGFDAHDLIPRLAVRALKRRCLRHRAIMACPTGHRARGGGGDLALEIAHQQRRYGGPGRTHQDEADLGRASRVVHRAIVPKPCWHRRSSWFGVRFFCLSSRRRRSIQMRREHPPHRGSGAARDGAGAKSEAAASDIAKLRYSNLASWPEANAHPPMVLPSPENNHGERWVSSL
jgi:hypothetical protein